jgi:hypothetical protein
VGVGSFVSGRRSGAHYFNVEEKTREPKGQNIINHPNKTKRLAYKGLWKMPMAQKKIKNLN